jgi:hypothetical protein
MKLTVNRLYRSENCTQGVITLDNRVSYVSLEPFNAIPEGKYRVTKYASPKEGYDVLLLHDVPGHSMIEWHVGNYHKDTLGCLLPGLYPGMDAVYNSRIAFNEIIAKIFPLLDAGKEVFVEYVSLY